MPRIILMLLLTACATSADAQVPAGQDQIACYNVITGRVFSVIECGLLICRGTDRSGRQYSGTQVQYGDGLGPRIPPPVEGLRNKEILCIFGPASRRVEANPFKRFHHRIAPKRRRSSANV